MFRNCIFCKAELGTNEVIEHFPVGRKLAFDEAKGRLWVVCKTCGQWNLSPLEERWEAIEECERLFRGTPMRVSTEHIGLARLSEGLELVGMPQRPEMAGWRYGEQFRRRHLRTSLLGAGTFAIGTAAYMGAQAGLFTIGAYQMANISYGLYGAYRGSAKSCGRLDLENGARVEIFGPHIAHARGRADASDELVLELPYLPLQSPEERKNLWRRGFSRKTWAKDPVAELRGAQATRALGMMLPWVNVAGGPKRRVEDAVILLERAGSPERMLAQGLNTPPKTRFKLGQLRDLPQPIRLAMEIAAHEETERRALLEGELSQLEQFWRDAEEIANIADNLLLPAPVNEFLNKFRR